MTADPRPTGPAVTGFAPPPAPGPEVIPGRWMQLERLDAARHAAEIWQAAQGADWIWDYLGYGPFAEPAGYAALAADLAAKPDPFFYAIREARSGRVLGAASLMRIDRANGVIEIGHILITPPLQRTVAASEAMMALIGWALDAGYRRVEWKCDALNAPSRSAALRLGFSFEGIFRQHMIYKGRNRDTAWLAIIDRDWPALKAAWGAWLDPANFDAEGQQRQRLGDLTAAAVPGQG